MARHSGENLALHFSATEGGAYASFGCFTQLSTQQARERFESTCGGDANKRYVLGKPDFTVTGNFVWDDTNDAMWEAADASTSQYYRVYPNFSDLPTWYWQGPFFVDASLDIPVAGVISGSINLAADGDIVRNT
jgi:hypothetical protein